MSFANEIVAIPIWAALVAGIAVVVLTVILQRLAAMQQVAAVVCIAALLAVFSMADQFLAGRAGTPSAAASDVTAERLALEARRAELVARATMPGSPLACLAALASEPVEGACERAIFANPTAAAVAVSYAAAQLRLLADGVAFAGRADPGYAANLNDLRRAAENDAYGIYAHVLATRDSCTVEQCNAFALLRDPSTLKVHLRQRLYASYVAQHRERWDQQTASATPAPAAAAPDRPADAPSAAAEKAAPASPAAAPVSTVSTPLPKERPAIAAAAGTEASVAQANSEKRPAAKDASAKKKFSATAEEGVQPSRAAGVVPPVASVLPNLDFPSASSIPPINIMAAEPKLPPEQAAPAAPSTAPRRPPPAQ